MKTLWLVPVLASILLLGVFAYSPISFADDNDDDDENLTELQEECSVAPENPTEIEPECELLNIINALKEDEATKNEQIDTLIEALQAKDGTLMAKDDQLMEKDNQLMDSVSNMKEEVVRICKNIPLFKEGLDTISFVTLSNPV